MEQLGGRNRGGVSVAVVPAERPAPIDETEWPRMKSREQENIFMQCALRNSMRVSRRATSVTVGLVATMVLAAADGVQRRPCIVRAAGEREDILLRRAMRFWRYTTPRKPTTARRPTRSSVPAPRRFSIPETRSQTRNMRTDFVKRYDQMHRVVLEPEAVTLYIGADNWPFPVSIVKNSSGDWYFDTESGRKEILYRRIGRNENDAIDILHSLVDAQRDYIPRLTTATRPSIMPRSSSATKASKRPVLEDQRQRNSQPDGPLLVSAPAKATTCSRAAGSPYHGYYYRILTKQGAAAKGGARDYMVNGSSPRASRLWPTRLSTATPVW